jgi:hypothetical protein
VKRPDFANYVRKSRANQSSAYANTMYSEQLITTDDAVMIMPGIVLRQPETSIKRRFTAKMDRLQRQRTTMGCQLE